LKHVINFAFGSLQDIFEDALKAQHWKNAIKR